MTLLQRAVSNDEEAWHRMVDLYAPLVHFWCRRWRVSEADLQDVFQEIFRAAAQNLDRFHKGDGGTFRGWLRTIARNKTCDHFRRLHKEPRGAGGSWAQERIARVPMPPEEEDREEADTASTLVVRAALEQIRGHFAERTWRAFWRTAVDGQGAKEVAEELSMTPVAVRVSKSRVLGRLREELGDLVDW